MSRPTHVLYAVDTDVTRPSATKKELLAAIRNHVIAESKLVARYGRYPGAKSDNESRLTGTFIFSD